jgi:predicted nuclease of predicted toxin-antitoxin system
MALADEPDKAARVPQVWIDAQLPPALAQWLRTEHGIDAVHVESLGLLTARDRVILAAARAAERRIIVVTKDDDTRSSCIA